MLLPLTNGEVALIDDADAPLVAGRSWSATHNKNAVYVRSCRLYLHRLVMDAKPGQIVDHIDGNGLDNRRCNLRFTTAQGNKANSHHGRYTSQYIGVSHKLGRQFQASAKHAGRNVHIGSFATELEAAKAYDAFVRGRLGSAAVTNF